MTAATELSPRLRVVGPGGVRGRAGPGRLPLLDRGRRGSAGDGADAIAVGFSIVPAALVLLSLVALNGYRLTRNEVETEWTRSRSGPR